MASGEELQEHFIIYNSFTDTKAGFNAPFFCQPAQSCRDVPPERFYD
jgi:hypothetical protein